MQQRLNVSASARILAAGALTLVTLASLTACGGGGGSSSGGTPSATVTAMITSPVKYSGTETLTINGTGLDSTLAVSSTICKNIALQAGSTATSATYTCTVSGGLTGTITAKSNGTQVAQTTLTVPAPVVTMLVNNGLSAVGNLVITLAPDKAPLTVDNFLHYVNTGFYNGTIFHRIVPGFVAQAGGYAASVSNLSTATLKTGLFTAIGYENSGLSNVSGSIAMAATATGAETSQFFFNVAANTSLDGHYTVYGSLTAGSSVMQTILAAPSNCITSVVDVAGHTETDCLPIPNVIITTATQTQ